MTDRKEDSMPANDWMGPSLKWIYPEIGETIDSERVVNLIRRGHFPWLSPVALRIMREPNVYQPWVFDG